MAKMTPEEINEKAILNMFSDLKKPPKPTPPTSSTSLTSSTSSTSLTSPTSLTSLTSQTRTDKSLGENQKRKQHTFKLTESLFQDFSLFVKSIGKTLDGYIDELVFAVVEDNSDFIEQLKRRRN